jgi:hypothetical protein
MQTTSGIIDTANKRRHNAMNGEAREGAIELLRLYNDHIGNVHALGFGAETKAVKYLLESFSMEENKKQCTLLGIDRLVTGLAETQNEIETLYAERTMLEPELDQYTLKNATEGAVVAVRRFLGYADLLIAGDETAYSEPGQAIAAILADVEAIARGRKTREENSDDKESGGPENAASEAA